jgi:hypothetical protein
MNKFITTALLMCFYLLEASAENTQVIANQEIPKDLLWGQVIANVKMAVQIGNISELAPGNQSVAVTAYLCNLGNSTITTADSFGALHGLNLFSKNDQSALVQINQSRGPGGSRLMITIPEGSTAVYHLLLSKEIIDASNGKIITGLVFASPGGIFNTTYSPETALPKQP